MSSSPVLQSPPPPVPPFAPRRASIRQLQVSERRFAIGDDCYVVVNSVSFRGGVVPEGHGQGLYVPALVRGNVADDEGRVVVVLELCDDALGPVTRRTADNTREMRVPEHSVRLKSVDEYDARGHGGSSTKSSSGAVWEGENALSNLDACTRTAAAEKRERERVKAEQVGLRRRADVCWSKPRWGPWRRAMKERTSLYTFALRYAARRNVPCSPTSEGAFIVFTERRHLGGLALDAARSVCHRWRAVYVKIGVHSSITHTVG